MEAPSLLQYFARNNQGKIVSVNDVARGLACDCICPECRRAVVAKQGNIKAWHFAHTSGADCAGGPMTALHLAAQQLIQSAGKIRIPDLVASESAYSAAGELLCETVVKPAELLVFDDVSLEVHLGDIQPDAVGSIATTRYFIEVAVTHFIDEQKHQKLMQHNVPTVEIDLSSIGANDWDSLYAEVIEGVELKRWVHHPDLVSMQNKVEEALRARLLDDHIEEVPASTPQPMFARAEWSRTYHFHQARVYVDGFSHYIRIRQTDFIRNDTFSAMQSLIRRLGGCTTGDRYWKVPIRAKEQLLMELKGIWTKY